MKLHENPLNGSRFDMC